MGPYGDVGNMCVFFHLGFLKISGVHKTIIKRNSVFCGMHMAQAFLETMGSLSRVHMFFNNIGQLRGMIRRQLRNMLFNVYKDQP